MKGFNETWNCHQHNISSLISAKTMRQPNDATWFISSQLAWNSRSLLQRFATQKNTLQMCRALVDHILRSDFHTPQTLKRQSDFQVRKIILLILHNWQWIPFYSMLVKSSLPGTWKLFFIFDNKLRRVNWISITYSSSARFLGNLLFFIFFWNFTQPSPFLFCINVALRKLSLQKQSCDMHGLRSVLHLLIKY